MFDSPAFEKFTEKVLRPLNLVFAGLGLGLSVALVAAEAHVYHTYLSQTAANNPFWLPVWPKHFQTAGTKTAIGILTLILVLHLSFIAVYLWRKVSGLEMAETTAHDRQGKSSHGMWESAPRVGFPLSVATLFLAMTSLVVNYSMNNRGPRTDTIETWTCKWSEPTNATAGSVLNGDFRTLCSETVSGLCAQDEG
jgi:hypothetical protein